MSTHRFTRITNYIEFPFWLFVLRTKIRTVFLIFVFILSLSSKQNGILGTRTKQFLKKYSGSQLQISKRDEKIILLIKLSLQLSDILRNYFEIIFFVFFPKILCKKINFNFWIKMKIGLQFVKCVVSCQGLLVERAMTKLMLVWLVTWHKKNKQMYLLLSTRSKLQLFSTFPSGGGPW